MATQTLSTADAILKDLYVGPDHRAAQLQDVPPGPDRARQRLHRPHRPSRRVAGPQVRATAVACPSRTAASFRLPAVRTGWTRSSRSVPRLRHLGLGRGHRGSKRNEGAFINILEAETQGVAKDMRKDINRQVYGTGDGLLATAVVRRPAGRGDGGLRAVPPHRRSRRPRRQGDGRHHGRHRQRHRRRPRHGKTVTLSPAPTTPASINNTYGLYLSGSRQRDGRPAATSSPPGARCTASTRPRRATSSGTRAPARTRPLPRSRASPCSSRSPTTLAAWATARSRCS
jgi:hypothetical protein